LIPQVEVSEFKFIVFLQLVFDEVVDGFDVVLGCRESGPVSFRLLVLLRRHVKGFRIEIERRNRWNIDVSKIEGLSQGSILAVQ
jgi:hypothetical protein